MERIPTDHLVRAWRQDFGINVAHLFAGTEHVEMRENAETGHVSFLPPILGDAAFYQALRRFKWYHPKQKREHEYAAELAKSGDLVLDVGAGNGDFARYLSGVEYLGLESDGAAVAGARARGQDLRDLTMDAWQASAEFRPANVVTAFQVLEHVSDPEAFLAEMCACLHEAGEMVIGVPDAESYIRSLPDFMLNAPPHHITWWTEAALTKLMAKVGLEVVETKRFAVEPWEYQLWWMAKFAGDVTQSNRSFFGPHLRLRKIWSFCLSWPLQWLAPPKSALGSTLVVRARQAGR
ncbi:MAG: class I SAM-dependent methyltransferase [Henriciella sp.]|nr:class I SAM-dependent methyltransferase [Henriciella sp.]